MKILIVEDEKLSADYLKSILEEEFSDFEILGIVSSVAGFNNFWKKSPQVDLIFLDIHLSDGLSTEFFDKIDYKTAIVFTTAYDRYAIQAFKKNSIGYLLKPIDRDDLREAIEKFLFMKEDYPVQQFQKVISAISQKKQQNRFMVKLGEQYISINVEEVAYFASEHKLTMIYTKNGRKFPYDKSLDELENAIEGQDFFRINRTFLVHISSVKKITNYFNGRLKLILEPELDVEIIVSRERVKNFKQWLGQ